ncbi:MAG TPA: DKNYY domain-containing protein [Pirellulaceae bacterium]|nr:DKNYY domain-containing protein [Pirellulaceae bacterium]
MSSARLIYAAACAIVLVAFGGCSKGYQREYGKWAYVWFDGDGRQVRYLQDAKGKLTVLAHPKYAKTADNVYLGGVKIPGADPATLEVVNDAYSKDAKRAYCGSIPIPGANPEEFRVLGGNTEPQFCSRAKPFENAVGPMPEVPPDLEIVGAQGWSTDGNNCYFGPTRLVGARAESFKMLNAWYATDGEKVFCGHDLLEEADAKTFRVSPRMLEAEDKNYTYSKATAKRKE